MRFLKKSLLTKMLLISTLFILIVLGLDSFAQKYEIETFSPHNVSIILLIVILGYVLLFMKLVINPLQNILKEIKSLLTGRKYNRIYTKKIDEIGVVAHFFNEVTHSLEKVSSDLKEQRRMSAELDVAGKIQRDLLPKQAPSIKGLSIIAKTRSAAEIGGDSFDFIDTKGENTIIYIGDVTGHGVPSGIGMTMVDTLMHTFCDMYDNGYEIMTQTNKYLSQLMTKTMFMTMSMLRWHKPTKQMFFTGAGHEYLVHYKAKEEKCIVKKAGGIALGMISDVRQLVKEKKLDFEEGDVIVLYTDGLTEARDTSGEMFGLERLIKIIENTEKDLTSEEIYLTISSEFSKFIGNHVQEDDMTLIIIKNREEKLSEDIKKTTQWESQELGPETLIEYKE